VRSGRDDALTVRRRREIKGQGSGAGCRRYDGVRPPGWGGRGRRPDRPGSVNRDGADWVQVRRAGRSTGCGERCCASPPVSVECRVDGIRSSAVYHLNPVDRSVGLDGVAVVYRAFIGVFAPLRFGSRGVTRRNCRRHVPSPVRCERSRGAVRTRSQSGATGPDRAITGDITMRVPGKRGTYVVERE